MLVTLLMDKITKRLCNVIVLIIFITYCICVEEVEHQDIFIEIKPYTKKGRIIDGFFKPDRMIGEGASGALWKGINFKMFSSIEMPIQF